MEFATEVLEPAKDATVRSVIIEKAWSRLHNKNANWLALYAGQTGSGKTYSALRTAELLDPTFTVDRCVFNAKEFMAVINSGLKKGQVVVFDEAGVGMPSKEWFSMSNKLLNYVLQTFRHRNIAVIFTTPALTFLDSAARKLVHFYAETLYIDRIKNQVVLKPFNLEFSPRTGKTYTKYPVIYEGGRFKQVDELRVNAPSQALVDAYEIKKTAYTKQLFADIEAKLNDTGEKKEENNSEELAEKVMLEPDKFIREHQGRRFVSHQAISLRFKVGRRIAQRVKDETEQILKEAGKL